MTWKTVSGAVSDVPDDTVTCNFEALNIVLGGGHLRSLCLEFHEEI